MNKRKLIILLTITTIGMLLRFYQLGNIPNGFHRDEAFLGYNAYSLLKTGRDMTGRLLPLHFESFLWSPGLYSYASIPAIALFGLSPFSVRFASAFFGTLTIPMLYLLVIAKNQFQVEKNKSSIKIKKTEYNNSYGESDRIIQHLKLDFNNRLLLEKTALLSAFFLCISPWHINLSRVATENTVAVFFLLLGIVMVMRFFSYSSVRSLIIGCIAFLVSLYVYQAPRAILPVLLPLLFFIFWKYMNIQMKIQYIICFFLFVCIPVLSVLTSKTLATRAATVGLFATEETQLVINESVREGGVMHSTPVIERLFHNKLLGYGTAFLKNYFAHVSYPFLFTDSGLPDRYRVPNIGLLYLFELPLILLGIFILLQQKSYISSIIIILICIPIGSAYAFDDVPNLQRTLMMAPLFSICSSVGLLTVYKIFQRFNKILLVISGLLFVYSISYYLHQYYIHMSIHKPWYRHEGYQQLVTKIQTLQTKYSKIIITNRESAPAIFFLFFTSYNPQQYQRETANPPHRSFDRLNFGMYEFSLEECPVRIESKSGEFPIQREFGDSGILYVNGALCDTVPKKARVIQTIYRGDNTKVFDLIDIP